MNAGMTPMIFSLLAFPLPLSVAFPSPYIICTLPFMFCVSQLLLNPGRQKVGCSIPFLNVHVRHTASKIQKMLSNPRCQVLGKED
jgi:hypothetical protein